MGIIYRLYSIFPVYSYDNYYYYWIFCFRLENGALFTSWSLVNSQPWILGSFIRYVISCCDICFNSNNYWCAYRYLDVAKGFGTDDHYANSRLYADNACLCVLNPSSCVFQARCCSRRCFYSYFLNASDSSINELRY